MNLKYTEGDIVLVQEGNTWVRAKVVEVNRKLYNDYLKGYYFSLPRIYKTEVPYKICKRLGIDDPISYYHANEMRCHKAIIRERKINAILS